MIVYSEDLVSLSVMQRFAITSSAKIESEIHVHTLTVLSCKIEMRKGLVAISRYSESFVAGSSKYKCGDLGQSNLVQAMLSLVDGFQDS